MTEPFGHPQLPDYDFDRELGRGGMGTVYLYKHVITQRPEVVKLLSPGVLARPGNRGRFEREIRAAFRLNHPNIVAAYSTHRVGDALAFCMEYVEGDDLMRVVQRDGPLAPGEAVAYVLQACHGLQHAFERGMVHRDIKPGNLMRTMVGGRTVVKVVDFGLAKMGGDEGDTSDTGLTQYGQVLGTPDFIAPEQIRNTSAADIRADLYSLGCTLYFLLAGRPPFRGESLFDLFEMHINAAAPNLDRVREGLPAGLAEVVARMMAKDPADRPQTPADAAELLVPFAQLGTHSAPALALPSNPALPTTAVSSAATPPAQRPAPPPTPIDAFVSLSPTNFDPPPSTRYKPVRTPPPPASRPGWLVPLGVGAFVLAGVVAVVMVLIDGPPTPVPSEPTPVITPPTTRSAPTPTLTPPTPTVVKTTPTSGTAKTTPTTNRPTTPGWYTALFGDPAGLKQTVWPPGDGWHLRDGKLTAPDAAEERLALFDLPPHGDFDLSAEVVVSGGAGLLVRGDRRAIGESPTGYLIGLGAVNPDAVAFECGAVHRWGIKNGRGKHLADGMPAWSKSGSPLKLQVAARGDRLSVKIDDRPEFHVRDADGYLGGELGLVTQGGGRISVHNLSVKPVAPPPPADTPAVPGFTTQVTPNRLSGWVVEGEDRYWEMAGPVLFGRQVKDNFNTKGHLLTAAEYANFVLKFDFLLKPGATALVSLRAIRGEKAEVTLNGVKTLLPTHPWLRLVTGTDDTRPRPASLERWFGGRANLGPARGQAVVSQLTADTWHEAEVRVDGTAIAVKLNGKPVEYPKLKLDAKFNDPEYPAGQERKAGHIGFCPFAGEVQFRNIWVKEL